MPKKKTSQETEAPKAKMGRPSKYTPELAALICERVATHDLGLPRLCKKFDDMPDEETIRRWLYRHPEFRGKYAQAKIEQADFLAQQCLEIADDDSRDIKVNDEGYETFNAEFAARSRLRVDTRKWLASKLLPKQYGDAKELQDEKDKNEQLREEIRLLREKLDAQNKKDY